MVFGIEKWTMLIMKSGKREIADIIELPNKKKKRNIKHLQRKKFQIFGNIGSEHHQTEMKEKRRKENLKRT